MIDKLIDTPYWNELPDLIKTQLDGKKSYYICQYRHGKQLLDILDFFCLLEPNLNFSLFSDDAIKKKKLSSSQKRHYWSEKRLVHFWTKRFYFIKSQIINQVVTSIPFCTVGPYSTYSIQEKELLNDFKNSLNQENNLQVLHQYYLKSQNLKKFYWSGSLKHFLKEIDWLENDDLAENKPYRPTMVLSRTGRYMKFKDIAIGCVFHYAHNYWVRTDTTIAIKLKGSEHTDGTACSFSGSEMNGEVMEIVETKLES